MTFSCCTTLISVYNSTHGGNKASTAPAEPGRLIGANIMHANQAIDYLEIIAANKIATSEMSRAMFRLVRAAARIAQRAYPGMSGYYDPEYTGQRADLLPYLFPQASTADKIPQSPRLLALLEDRFPIHDAWGEFMLSVIND